MSQIQYNKGWCCLREYPYALPEPKSLTKIVKEMVDKEIEEITKAKFEMPSPEDYEKARKLSRGSGSDGSLASKVREEAGSGAPPSADNNV